MLLFQRHIFDSISLISPSLAEPGAKAAPDNGDTGGQQEGGGAVSGVVTINRASTLTLWVATVAERQGYAPEEALTFGKYVSGVFAHSKGEAQSFAYHTSRQKAPARCSCKTAY